LGLALLQSQRQTLVESVQGERRASAAYPAHSAALETSTCIELELQMKDRRTIVLVGDSLLMDTVEASLGDSQEFGVMRIYTTVTDIAKCLESLCPDAIIFDWDVPQAEFVLSMLRNRPGIPLIGLDVTCSKAIALFSEQHITLTVNDLAEVVKTHISGKVGPVECSGGATPQEREPEGCQ
jgi:hypothetical protein